MNRSESHDRKIAALRTLLASRQARGILLQSQAAASWLTGARTFINLAAETSCLQVLVTEDAVYCLANNIEALRLQQEEAAGYDAQWVDYPWYDPGQGQGLAERLTGAPGRPLLTESDIAGELFELMNVLDAYEQAAMRRLAVDTVEAVQQVAREFAPGESEFAVAGRLARAFWERGAEPIVLLVAGDGRAMQRRHPVPTEQCIDHYGLLVACGRRQGLVASATRSIVFGRLPDDLRERQAAAGYVDAVAIAHSRPGVALADIFSRIQRAYEEGGFPGEWERHHQGGVGGYGSRTRLAVPSSDAVLQAGMTVAWNPTVMGAKSEDTCLVREDGPEVLGVKAGSWPTSEHRVEGLTLLRPDILAR